MDLNDLTRKLLSDFKVKLRTEKSDVYVLMSRNGTSVETARKWSDAADQLRADGVFQRIEEKWADFVYQKTGAACEINDGVLYY